MKPYNLLATAAVLFISALIAQARPVTPNWPTAALVSGTFKQVRQLQSIPMPLRSHGQFSYSSDSGLRWQSLAPFEVTIHIDPQGRARQREKGAEWIDIDLPPMASTILVAIIAQDQSVLLEHFEVIEPIKDWDTSLVPRYGALSNELIRVDLRGTSQLEAVRIVRRENDITEISFHVEAFSPATK